MPSGVQAFQGEQFALPSARRSACLRWFFSDFRALRRFLNAQRAGVTLQGVPNVLREGGEGEWVMHSQYCEK
jgi:hypothetical protein